MLNCKCFQRNNLPNYSAYEPDTFSLPDPLPSWPPGQGFACGRIGLSEIEVVKISKFRFIWGYGFSQDRKKGVSFYKPMGVPRGFYCLGHYCQANKHPITGFLLVAREVASTRQEVTNGRNHGDLPALARPVDYTLVWTADDQHGEVYEGCGFFWLPVPPEGYKPMGFLVTSNSDRPQLDEIRCVRSDLTDECETYRRILDVYSTFLNFPFGVWSIRPCDRGMKGRGVPVGTFFCSSHWKPGEELNIACLKNLDSRLHAMPNLEQIHAIVHHYGPRVYFHPDEVYLPSSVSWFFEKGAVLCKADNSDRVRIDIDGSNLPGGGMNDGAFWIDLPSGEQRDSLVHGNLESAKLYVHVKPAFGGTFSDMAMWVFCPFNGPATLKLGPLSFSLSKIGQHVGDWEHFTLRVCNFTGELWGVYFSQHSGGEWVSACDLEYTEGNKPIVYSSRNGHASYPHPCTYIQGSAKLGIGIRNDAIRSDKYISSSARYEVVAAEYLGDDVVVEPCWLQFMRKWGPRLVYDSRAELEKIIKRFPLRMRYSIEGIFAKLPMELSGEDGPTGPKEKNNWVGDERW
ncbi:unnamed protein product [Linum tenue]|uniref:Vacuolar protein sorting-associated protein 62 n=1 Tax=Linum tenue TaxID=586396 RepID=A0AAV0HLW9_9ROSI|nr:unnamed protein product [Linum tenue]